ncbi:MAG: 3-deoxy-manno-octulosonate cytidylyltransferase [Alphaproteobacteria bacterium]|nr:3-deoxy-manno-octulosonate cytidylyltransferase [Alphaproteobacteria bacterium]
MTSRPQNPVVLIPARLGSMRLPDKPLADIHGVPMIVHVWRRAMEAELGPVVVAAGEQSIIDAVGAAGGRAVLTPPELPSGSDRIHAALLRIDPEGRHDAVVNVQGDLPTVARETIRASMLPLEDARVDIATLGVRITRPEEHTNPNVVKAIVSMRGPERRIGRALYFTRATAPTGDGPRYHHIGLYTYRRAALERFVKLPPSPLERQERLEQLRALEADMRIDIAIVDAVPLGVDTLEDLERARALISPDSTRPGH